MSALDTIAAKARAGRLKGTLGGSSPPGGPSLFLVLGVAFATGVVLAKWIDWRDHAHPRR
jgi:hypothetical protein